MKRAIISILFTFSTVTGAQAACPWQHVGALGMDIEQGRDLLKNYGACRTNCNGLEAKLNASVNKFSKASSCGRHIISAQDNEMINFISSRSRLIKKQKKGLALAQKATPQAVEKSIEMPESGPIGASTFVAVEQVQTPKMQTEQAPVQAASAQVPMPSASTTMAASNSPQPQQMPDPGMAEAATPQPMQQQAVAAGKQTKMAISSEAYTALFIEDDAPQENLTAQQKAQRQAQRQAQIRAQQQANQKAKLQQAAKQRADQQRKQALIRQQQLNVIKAKKLAMQRHQVQQRQAKLRLIQQRALKARQERLRIQKLKLARARR